MAGEQDMVEIAARAMFDDEWDRSGAAQEVFEDRAFHWRICRRSYLRRTLSTLRAMREPTALMVEAAGGLEVNMERADDPSYRPADIWAAMIDAALSHHTTPAPETDDAREGR